MKNAIQLNPFLPPLHHALDILKKKAKKEVSRGIKGIEVNILEQRINSYLGVKNFGIVAMGPAHWVLPSYISSATDFLNFSEKNPDIRAFTPSPFQNVEYYVQLVDFCTGKVFDRDLAEASYLIDLTGIAPYSEPNGIVHDLLALRLDGYMGTDLDWVVVLEKDSTTAKDVMQMPAEMGETMKLLNYIFEDLAIQKDLVLRDYKYKAALLENMIAVTPDFSFSIHDSRQRSKTVFSFYTENMPARAFRTAMLSKGFDLGLHRDTGGKEHVLVANFIGHSKEQIEAFVDAVSVLNH